MRQKPYDQYVIGEVFETYGRTITEADIVMFTCFAGLKLPLFINEDFCKKHTPFKTRIAPGFMTASIAAGMMEDILGPYTIAALTLDKFKFTKPVIAGNTIRSKITVENKKATSDGQRGVLTVRVNILNENDDLTLEFWGSFMSRKGEL